MSGDDQGIGSIPEPLSGPVAPGPDGVTVRPDPTWAPVMFAAMFANMVGTTPFFFIGAFGPSIRLELGIDEFQLGLAAAAFNVGAMLSVFQAGRVGERYGYRRTVILGCLATVFGMVASSASGSFNGLLIALVAAGLGNALVQPAANAILARWVPARRQGLAFGLKQASIPAAALIAGLGLATLSSDGDWRRLFIMGAMAPLVAVVLIWTVLPADRGSMFLSVRTSSGRIFRQLFLFTFAAFLASSAGAAVAAFATESAVNDGLSARSAGLWYVWGAGTGVLARVLLGSAGSWFGHRVFLVAAGLMILGGVGPLLLAGEPSWISQAVGTTLAWGAGWGWTGLFHYGIVRTNPSAPALASGVILTGLFGGSVAGPPLFGAGVTLIGWDASWQLCGACFFVAAAVLVLADRRASIVTVWPRQSS